VKSSRVTRYESKPAGFTNPTQDSPASRSQRSTAGLFSLSAGPAPEHFESNPAELNRRSIPPCRFLPLSLSLKEYDGSKPNRVSMNCKQRTIFLLVVFWSVVIGAVGIWYWRADRQEQLNRQLIDSIKREDTSAALVALEQGADGNARDEPRLPGWKRLWDLVRGRRSSLAEPAISFVVRYETKEDSALIEALLSHGAHIELPDDGLPSLLWHALASNRSATARILIELTCPRYFSLVSELDSGVL